VLLILINGYKMVLGVSWVLSAGPDYNKYTPSDKVFISEEWGSVMALTWSLSRWSIASRITRTNWTFKRAVTARIEFGQTEKRSG
jgi:hypothetical protein